MKLLENNPHWREILVAVLSAVLAGVAKYLDMEGLVAETIAFLGGTYAAGGAIAGINPKKRFETVGRKLKSKKFRLTLLNIALTVLGAQLGIDLTWAIGIIGGLFNIGQGVADVFDKDPGDVEVYEPEVRVNHEAIRETADKFDNFINNGVNDNGFGD